MGESGEIAGWISQLADADFSKRRSAAWRLHAAGEALARVVNDQWMTDPELRELANPLAGTEQGRGSAGGVFPTVGVAVQPEQFRKIHAANGSPRLARVPPDQDAQEFELQFGDHVDLDILTTRKPGGTGAIARYLQKFGEGIQQIEVKVADVDRATDILRTRFSLPAIYPATRAGADGTRVNFFLVPSSPGRKVLIELVEGFAKK